MSALATNTTSLDDVIGLMHGLFALQIKPVAKTTDAIYSIAEYANEAGEVVGYIGCDLAGGCRLGAALTQVPAGRVAEAVAEGALPESLAENLDEVFNISVKLIVPAVGGRVVFKRAVHGSSDAEFASIHEKLKGLPASEFCFDVARYGVCRMVVAN